jgi:hypothetical protein
VEPVAACDLTVQEAGGADSANTAQAAYWSCQDCGHGNDLSVYECGACGERTRPIWSDYSCWNLWTRGIPVRSISEG